MMENTVQDFDPFTSDDLFITNAEVVGLIQSGKQIRNIEEEEAKLREFDADDAGNAEAVCWLYKDKVCYTGAYGWMRWNGTHYEQNEAGVWRAVEDTLQKRRLAAVKAPRGDKGQMDRHAEAVIEVTKANAYRVRGCMDSLKARVTRNVEEFDADPDKVNVLNGVLNLRTGELEEHNPSQLYTYCMPVKWDEKADYTEWEELLLKNIKGGREMVDFVQEAVGYTLTGHTSEEKLFYPYGPSRSGKGTFTETLQAMMGALSAGVPFSTFTRRRDTGNDQGFDLAPLKQARLIVASESERNERLKEGMVKEITGGGTIRAAFKHRDSFEYRPAFKIWLTSNWSIKADGDDEAFWRRVVVIEFPNGQEEGKENPAIKLRMKSTQNLEGVLKWAVEGAKRWYERGRLAVPQMARESRNAQREENDTVGQWLEECCVSSTPIAGAFTEGARIRHSYEMWCNEQGYPKKGPRAFNESLRRRGFGPNEQGRDDITRNSCKGVRGLRLERC